MIITSDELDIEQYELDKIRPATLLQRRGNEIWLVRETPLETDLSNPFSFTREFEHVRIPLFPYLSRGVEPARALAMAAKLGAMLVNEVGPAIIIERLHITLGHPVQDLTNAFRFWIGFGMVITER